MKSLRIAALACFALGSTLPGMAQFHAAAQPGAGEEVETRIFIAPGFLDPESDADTPPELRARRPSAKDVLERAGIVFPAGASAIYNPATEQLIARNTPEQHERIAAHLATILLGWPLPSRQVHVSGVFNAGPALEPNHRERIDVAPPRCGHNRASPRLCRTGAPASGSFRP